MPESVENVVEPALFPHAAVACTLSALVDNLDHTVVFVVEAREPIAQRLTGLWSSGPQPFDSYLATMHEAHAEWLKMLWENSGPFA
jgi:hypothetical protein